ncbi:hypothetical protein GCM10023196_044810 [Actinoallomurus vinaceus]|uniref:Large catalase C-terminal domain-containing protein n=1 Tax=Actinoallomurus vinaceus TaxID=1080074 RepID=A0ABP8UF45_9ACTN
MQFVAEAFKHGKAIGAVADGIRLLSNARLNGVQNHGEALTADQGVVLQSSPGATGEFVEQFVAAIAAHRHHNRDLAPAPA